MAVIRIGDFKGNLPRAIPRLLPDSFSQVALNTRLENGAIGPLRGPTTVQNLGALSRSIYFHNGVWRSWAVAGVDAVPGPVAQDRLYITGDGDPKLIADGTSYPLAVARPTQAPDATLIGTLDEALSEEILFVYTFVTSLGEESAPSPASAPILWSPGLTVRVDAFETPATARVNKIRIYRSQTSAIGVTDFYFVAEFNSANVSYIYNPAVDLMAEAITATDYDAPLTTLEGLTGMPNGMMAAFSGKELYFCEPFIPHAWPQKYSLTVDYNIVGLASFGSMLAVLTTGTPYIVQGNHPENMTMEKVEQNLPCLAKRGIVDMGYSVVFPSSEGLVVLSQGGAQIVSRGLYTREQWDALNPATFVASQHAGRYVFSHLNAAGTARTTRIIDVTGAQPFEMTANIQAAAMHLSVETGTLYFVLGTNSGTIVYAWDKGDYYTQIWRSKLFHLPAPVTFGAAMVEGDALAPSPTFTCRVYADGALLHTFSAYNEPVRLPDALAQRWEIEVEGTLSMTSIALAGSPTELAGG